MGLQKMTCCDKPSIFSKLEKASHEAGENLEELAAEIRKDPKAFAYNAGKKLRAALDGTNENMQNIADTAKTEIKKRPLEAAVAALGIGALLGWLAGGRK